MSPDTSLLTFATTIPGLTVVAALATQMALVHHRSAHLSDLARRIVEERLYKLEPSNLPARTKERHAQALEAQGQVFNRRYRHMSIAFLWLVVTWLCLLPALAARAFDSDLPRTVGMTIGLAGIISFAVSLVITALDFLRGNATLESQLSVMLQPLRGDDSLPD
jgi:hypothetical protein